VNYTNYQIQYGDDSQYAFGDTVLGKGGFGVVYKGLDLTNNEPCVVKVLEPTRMDKI